MRCSGFLRKAGKTGAVSIAMTCVGIFAGVLCALIVGLLVFVSCSIGSDRPFSRKKIADYVERNFAISGFTVSSEPQKRSADKDLKRRDDTSERYDYLWTVTEADGTQFSVWDYYCYSNAAFSSPRRLRNNYNSVHAKLYLQSAEHRGFVLRGDVNDFYGGIWLEAEFTSRSELRSLVDRLNALAAGCPRGVAVPYWLKYKHPFRSPLKENKHDFGDTVGVDGHSWLESGTKLSYEKCERNMLEVLVDMRYETSLRDFTDAEIHAFVQGNTMSFGITQNDGSYKVYDDLLLGHENNNGLSLATAYEVMKRSGYKAEGTSAHFSFQGADGHSYEFSDSFIRTLPCWYLKDGQRVPLDEYAVRRGEYCYHISLQSFKEMTGIECVYYSRVEKAKEGTGAVH